MIKTALFTVTALIGIATMSINLHASASSVPLIPERFVSSINDDRDLDFQTIYPDPDAKGIQIMKHSDLVIDSHGNLYVTGPRLLNDLGYGASSLSKITPTGAISILTLEMDKLITSMTIDSHDNIYLSAYSHFGLSDSHAGGGYSMVPKFISKLTSEPENFTVRKLEPNGQLSMFIPKNKSDQFFNFSVDSNGVLYSDSHKRLVKISDRRLMGRKTETFIDFAASSIERSVPAMVIDADNNLVYVERNFHCGDNTQHEQTKTACSYDLIKKISPTGTISDLAGLKVAVESNDGVASKAGFKNISSLAIDHKGNIYALEPKKKTIRKISGDVVSTVVNDTGVDALSIAIHGTDIYILRKTGIDVIRKLPL